MSLLITNRKSHTGFRLVATSMTLNDLDRRNSPYIGFLSPNSTDFQADYITVYVCMYVRKFISGAPSAKTSVAPVSNKQKRLQCPFEPFSGQVG